MLHLDYNTDLNAETLASMQASGLLYAYLTDVSCTNVALGVITPGDYRWLTLRTSVELYAPIDEDVQWGMQNDQGELDFANLAAYMDIKVGSQKEKSHFI
ncbi:hypothetical protein PHET_04963 [Paragonimus heterotremus]|uniref:Uncharacterized protein n=1 Tax=Paragonimus heterotremus TaxID=100268 RepID=A0A8J4SYP6_9TREM|nr:hypothetical protein PHET_04963 [Paragonimus heterotremus]